MKRTIAPFAVEYKRRSKRGKTAETSLWAGAIGSELKDLLRSNDDVEKAEDANARTSVNHTKPVRSATNPDPSRKGARPPVRILETRQIVRPSNDDAPETQDDRAPADWDDELAEIAGPAADAVPERAATVSSVRKVAEAVVLRRARMRGLDFQDRWKWNLPD